MRRLIIILVSAGMLTGCNPVAPADAVQGLPEASHEDRVGTYQEWLREERGLRGDTGTAKVP